MTEFIVENKRSRDRHLRHESLYRRGLPCINSSHCGIEDFIEKISGLSDVKKILVYGTEDDDFDTDVPTLRALACDSLEIILVDGADHHFTGRVDDFIALVDLI